MAASGLIGRLAKPGTAECKVPANSGFFLSLTLDDFPALVKIKIVRESKTLLGAGIRSRAQRASVRPYNIRVVRDHGGGLWTLEDNDGQTYLAVLSYTNSAHRRMAAKLRQASGTAYT